MTLRQFIRDNTDGGHNIVRVLIDVMEGRLDGTKINHRLTAARLLTIYGHDDADDFIDYNTYDSPPKVVGDEIWYDLDTGLRAIIKEKTEDGYVICLLLIDVMEGKIKDATVGHRVSAAKELLNRAFGKAQSRPLPKSTGPIWMRRPITSADTRALNETPKVARRWPVHTDRDGQATTPSTHPPVVPAKSLPHTRYGAGAQRSRDGQALTPRNDTSATSTAVLPEPEQASDPEAEARRRKILFDINNDPWYTILDSEIYDLMCECEHPDFDPHLAAFDEDYFQSFTDCTDPECLVHGEDPEIDFDPNDFHY